jgi:hypothetical protein
MGIRDSTNSEKTSYLDHEAAELIIDCIMERIDNISADLSFLRTALHGPGGSVRDLAEEVFQGDYACYMGRLSPVPSLIARSRALRREPRRSRRAGRGCPVIPAVACPGPGRALRGSGPP